MTLCCDPHVKSPNINQISQKKIDRISSKIYLVTMGKGLDCYSRVPYLLFLYNYLDKNYSQMKKKTLHFANTRVLCASFDCFLFVKSNSNWKQRPEKCTSCQSPAELPFPFTCHSFRVFFSKVFLKSF